MHASPQLPDFGRCVPSADCPEEKVHGICPSAGSEANAYSLFFFINFESLNFLKGMCVTTLHICLVVLGNQSALKSVLSQGVLSCWDQVAAEEKEDMQRKAKMRTMGNIRLIGELFRKKIVRNRIVHMCIQELIGNNKAEPPHEEQVEVGLTTSSSALQQQLLDRWLLDVFPSALMGSYWLDVAVPDELKQCKAACKESSCEASPSAHTYRLVPEGFSPKTCIRTLSSSAFASTFSPCSSQPPFWILLFIVNMQAEP